MGRKEKDHKPINDSFENVLDAVISTPVKNKRIKKDKKHPDNKPDRRKKSK